MKFIFLDVEATGVDEQDRLIQVAYKWNSRVENALFKPPLPIKLPAMAVHHVTEKMVADKPAFIDSTEFEDLKKIAEEGAVLVAHNAVYDLGMLKKEGIEFPVFIDTLKVARFIDDGQFENHQMQYLRYFYGIEIEATAHDALGDILVLEQVTKKLSQDLAKKENIIGMEIATRMIEISAQPSLFRKFNFGKYNGSTIEEVVNGGFDGKGRSWMEWLLSEKLKSPEGDEDWIYTLKHYLQNENKSLGIGV